MGVLLGLLAAVAFAVGASVLSGAENAIHEIEAFILFLIGAVFASGVAVVDAVNALRKEVATVNRQATKE